MTEPTLEPGESYADFIAAREARRAEIEVAMTYAEPWERDELKPELSAVWFELEWAYKNLGATPPNMEW